MNKSVTKHWKRGKHLTKESKLVGCFMPPAMFGLIGLYGASLQISKSSVMRDVFQRWMDENKICRSTWIVEIVTRVQSEWNTMRFNFVGQSTLKVFNKYRKEIADTLLRQGLLQEDVDEIMRRIKQ